jgi:predicted NUDIX family NTP pyrophosphohydrolase
MGARSAGILLYRRGAKEPEVFLVHFGGPYWQYKHVGGWSIPKGEYSMGEDPLAAAIREFQEETGQAVSGPFAELWPIKQTGGKVVAAWAVEGTCDASAIRSNTFMAEWPPKSGKQQEFPEVDEAAWFGMREAHAMIVKGQRPFLDELTAILSGSRTH